MRLFNRYLSGYDVLLVMGDVALVVFATVAARFLMVLAEVSDVASWTQWLTLAGLIMSLIVISFYYADLYHIDQTLSQRELILRFVNGFGIASILIGVVSYPIQEAGSKNIYLIEISLIGLGLLAWRLGFMILLRRAKIRGKLLILGLQTIGKQVSEQLCRQKHLGLEVVGFIGPEAGSITLSYGNPHRVTLPVFPRDSILTIAASHRVSRILVAEGNGNFPGRDLITLRLKGIPIEDCHSFYERLMSKISITDLHPGWIARSTGFRRTRWLVATKTVIDQVVSALGLILASPLALITAIAIRLESVGPILYCQERVGQDERIFTLYKFRSMSCDAEANTGPIWAKENDPRVTWVGRVIRKLRIDEIPQMLNVLKGDMSFVGPRPERPFFVSILNEKIPYYQLRFSVKPGITGWAQVSYGYGENENDAVEKLQYDLYYLKNMSPIFDLQILFETVKVVLLGRGSQ
jgi:sugar transferase (PEP-CTERM system associated)